MLAGVEWLVLALMLLVLLAASLTRSPVAILFLAAVLLLPLAVAAQLVGVGPGVEAGAAPSSASGVLRLCWLTVRAQVAVEPVGAESYHIIVRAELQAPDPCHRVVNVVPALVGGTLRVTILGESPPEGTYCVQVLPKPVPFGYAADAPRPPSRVVFVLEDQRSGLSCEAVLPLAEG